MKKIIIVLSSFLSFSLFAADKVLFIDANDNPTEIKVAREAAQAQGKEIVIYPGRGKKVNEEELSKLFDNHSFSSVSFSGHSGALSFYGEHGELNLHEFVSLIKDKPSAKNIQSLYLLGCNTGNKSKIMFWKEALPNLKFIAGFDGVSPLGTNQAGLNYYADVLKNENKILSSANAIEIKNNLESLKNVKSFPTSLLVKCNEQTDYLYQPKTNLGKTFSNFTVKECVELIEKFGKEYVFDINQAISGKVDPKKLPSTTLKKYYEAARQKEHCEEDNKASLDANKILFLRFIQGFDSNFSNYFQKQLGEMIDQLKIVSNDLSKNIDTQIKMREEELAKIENSPDHAKNIIDNNLKSIDKMLQSLGTTPLVKGCIEALSLKNMSDSEIERRCIGETINEKIAIEKVQSVFGFKTVINRINEKSMKTELIKIVQGDIEKLKESLEEKELLANDLRKYTGVLEKMKSNPSSLSREEVFNLTETNVLDRVGINPDVVRKSTKLFEAYALLNPTVFPYSWYDKPYSAVIEDPLDSEIANLNFSNMADYSLDHALFRSSMNISRL